MEGISTDLGKTFVEKLINGVIGKSRYLFCYKCIANEFELEKEKLEAEWETMTLRFTKAKEKGKDIQSNAQFWEKQANKLIQENTKLKQRCFFGFCPDCIWLYKRGEELANKTEEIKKLMVKGEKLENVEVTRSLPDVERYSSQSYISFKTRESKYNELLNALKDDSYYTIGLHGMGGTGKTTMAKEVGKQLKTSMQFNRVIFTTVSSTPNIKKIQDDIAGHLELEWRDTNESTRPTQLWDRLINGEKILVILDDVWDYLNFEDIGIPNSDNHKGCKVLVTTRYLKVCNKMSCATTIQIELLSEEEAWEMFKRHAELSNISSKNILDQGSKIALECKGLPIAIATIARSLKGEKRQENWDAALNSLQNPMLMAGVDDTKVDIYKCLKFSYDNLKDKEAKELFLLCSIFQEDEEISTEILTRLGIGIGLFGEDYKKYNHARTLVVVAKDNLLDSCLLLSTNKRDVKMHDLIREVAQWIANKEILAVDFSNKTQKSLVGRDNNIKYLLFEGNPMDLCSSGFDGSKLKILIFIVDNGCFVDSFFKSIAGLLVLNLRAGKQSTISLPQSIRSLTNIHSLLIESVYLGDISVLGSLQSLETLDLNQCIIEELPQEIAKLKKLRLLNLEMCEIIDKNPFEVIQRCPSLEELYFLNSFNDSCQEITLPALERYQLIDDIGEMYDFSLSKCVSLQYDCLSEATVKHVIPTAEILRLEGTKKGWRNLMPEIYQMCFPI
ncbi:disease resistance protein SUMM2-like [Trifolium pratense]|uniref:disease resistance protein SUMM2-like n=1 Tax=Trifolium pratense TaxID=57577 RepID=UPI001E693710|nr:disease resistance protein SUMM2-like [Trifolium pratense]